MTKEYIWEIQPMTEVKPIFVATFVDSVLAAAKAFEEAEGTQSIRYIRKKAVTERVEYGDLECWEVG